MPQIASGLPLRAAGGGSDRGNIGFPSRGARGAVAKPGFPVGKYGFLGGAGPLGLDPGAGRGSETGVELGCDNT